MRASEEVSRGAKPRKTSALRSCDIVDAGLADEMGILGPERGPVSLGHRIDDTVGQGQVLRFCATQNLKWRMWILVPFGGPLFCCDGTVNPFA